MKISYNWLSELLKTDLTVDQASVMLTAGGLEVENVESFESVKGGLKGLFVGEVLTCSKHPNADKLSLTTVNVGGEAPLQIVCGAPNVAAGQKVIVAIVGTTVHPVTGEPFEIKKSKIRGELSEGMICAEDEIGLGVSHAGILVLPNDAQVGTKAADFLKIETDSVIEIGLTPNRADAASHLGVARDLSALINTVKSISTKHVVGDSKVVMPDVSSFKAGTEKAIEVVVEDTEACPRYTGITISNIKVDESPKWLKNRLLSIGVNPINNVVDITNFVLHEIGQPLHAFDADKIVGKKVIVRTAKAGEKFVTLDKIERTLQQGNLMICSAENPMCIAGVFGGIDSGITESTTSVFLESAYFDAASIRKTSKQHGLKTDASFRFERGTDPEITLYALQRAALLMQEICGGKIVSPVIDVYPNKKEEAIFSIKYSYIDQFSGEVIDRNVISTILLSLGIKIVSSDPEGLNLHVPSYKVDVLRPVDVIEEILRVYGYDRIPLPKKQSISLPAIVEFDREQIQNKVADYLAAQGFNEILTNSLTKSEYTSAPGWNEEHSVKILNPLSQELGVMRQDLLMTGLEILEYNRNRRQVDQKVFEFGKVYSKTETGYSESYALSLLACGKKQETSWQGPVSTIDFFFLKSVLVNVLTVCGIKSNDLTVKESENPAFSYGLTYFSGTKILVEIGAVKSSLLKKYDLNDVFSCSFNWDLVIRKAKKKAVQYQEVSKFPAVKRDLSMMVDVTTSFSKIEEIAFKSERKLLKEVSLFDLYQGEKIEAGKKSMAVSFILLDDQQTLTDKQIDKTMERLMVAFESEAGAVIRRG
ncbi:MAG TPA: phenylalanine--tRNA ligase subunit beta [Bacteroidia bacterium]|nr:phenylalanine--tRNA ligase subunit beta [Bacteroidia bacterium]